ncbi:nickel pincer cofactor biosynthesis protein LarC [Gemmata sp.]|uniref:nickel pincer cofactor biosynthesis protein LarC n=1 Tax=Gemmata sp. TaxID=1914242 RepID=UPI003F6F1FC9
MQVAHFDCFSGVSGDMVLGAVLDAGVPADAIHAALGSLGLPITLEVERVKRCGFAATKANVIAADQEDYRFLPDILAILERAAVTPKQRELAGRIFQTIAEAEAAAHGMPLERVHFHEVGALDSIADIVGAAVGLDLLGVERFTSSPVPTGTGTVKAAHGIMPVPTPGTLQLLKGVPLAPSKVEFELTTPTGAAILTSVVTEYTASPAMVVEKIGHGAGTKDFLDRPNILRLMVGHAAPAAHAPGSPESDTVAVLETNLDDVPAEIVGYCTERLFAAGALDVFVAQVQMKKGRPGVLVSVICEPAAVPELEAILFRETGTFGVRRHTAARSKLRREAVTVETPWGPVKAKRGWRADGFAIVTPEYDDCARVAREQGVALRDVYAAVTRRAGPGA